MCVECFNIVKIELAKRHWTATEDEIHHFLMSCTNYPFGEPVDIDRRLKELLLKFNNCVTWTQFCNLSLAQTDFEIEIESDIRKHKIREIMES